MNKHLPRLSAVSAVGDALKPAEMSTERIAEIQSACEAVATFATLYRATPHHPAVSDYRANRMTQFLEAYHALKEVIDEH